MTRPTFRVLVVDDNPSIHEDFLKILCPRETAGPATDDLVALEWLMFDAPPAEEEDERGRFVIDTASQGEEALEMIAEAVASGAPYALAFVDVRMPPGLSGIETLARAWQLDPQLQAVICTAFSDYSWRDMTRTLRKLDGFVVLRKPFETIEALQLAHALSEKWLLSQKAKSQLEQLERRVFERTRDLEATNDALRGEIVRRHHAERELSILATHDALTGLPNRVLLKERLDSAIARSLERGTTLGLCLVDLDQFKDVNDSYGHPVGDALLQEISRRLCKSVREGDTVARMGGDEFVAIVEADSVDAVARVAQRILATCSEPCSVGPYRLVTPPSIGIAIHPGDATDTDTLLKCADLAMYEAKNEAGATYRFYSPTMSKRSIEQIEMRQKLTRAIEDDELVLFYQPLVEVATGRVRGLEALVRWQSPELGLVPPDKFIPLAERTGLIVPIGRWVVETACRQLAAWRRELGELTVAVNVSAVQLRSPDFVGVVANALASCGLPPQCLELEITESIAMDDEHLSHRVLGDLAALGARIVIDDFGSGYSSMMRLKTMPIHGIKIDREFLRDITEDRRDAMIVAAILTMARSLGLSVVAEGIERSEQLELIRNLSRFQTHEPICDTAQGYLLGRPMPVEAVTRALREARAAAPRLRRAG